jgi:hypothetical protein
MAIEPQADETRLVLSVPLSGTTLKARFPALPAHPRAVVMLLESISAWYRRPITAALDADALGVQHHPERWSEFVGDLPGMDVTVEWVSRGRKGAARDRFIDALGEMRAATRTLTFAATGQK